MSEEARVSALVAQVVGNEIRRRGLLGAVIASPPAPECDLLERWLSPSVRVERVGPGLAEAARHALGTDGDLPWLAAGLARAEEGRLLAVHAAHKSRVLLEAPFAPCFPLGDLWGHQLAEWCGSVTPPPVLSGARSRHLEPVERAIAAWLEGGLPRAEAFHPLPPEISAAVTSALEAGRSLASIPLVPKLTRWTLGIDPSP